MTRTARLKSSTGIYHLVVRGINRQNIFETPEDRKKYLEVLIAVKEISGFKLYAYCLMDNHIHLLIEEGPEGLDVVFKRLGARYVMWFNGKYERTGTLFQGRFFSEPVESEPYLLSVLRYIHRNPVKAGICKSPENFKWSSYSDYLGKGENITDTAFALLQFSQNLENQRKQFIEFMKEEGDEHADVDQNSTDAIREKMMRLCEVGSVSEFQSLEIQKKEEGVRKLRKSGLSIRQISRITGMPFRIVRELGIGVIT